MTTIRKGQVRLGPRTWALIREAYLKGASAASLAETYGCSLGTIRYRAVREGWRRCDVEGFEPARAAAAVASPPDEPDEAASPEEMMGQALAAAARAVASGRPSEAAAYLRVAETLQRMGSAVDGAFARADAEEAEEAAAKAAREARTNQLRAEIERRLERIRQAAEAGRGG